MEDKKYIHNRDVIDLYNVFLLFWNKKKLIISITSVFAVFSILFALSLPNTYTSSVLLAPADTDDSLQSQLPGLPSISGVPSFGVLSSNLSKNKEGIARIRSFEFFSNYFLPNIKLENLIAVKDWDPLTDNLKYDNDIFNDDLQEWVRDVEFPQSVIPSEQEAYESYIAKLLVVEDLETSFIRISIDHHSPKIAQKWVNIIVNEINESMRRIDADIAERSISYLNEKSSSTNIQPIQEAISKLLENQMKILMLTYSNQSYVFKTLDSPIAPEKNSGPNRAVICIVITFFGGLISIICVLIQYFFEYRKGKF